ncbi:MAG: hypothetical protein ACE5WD_13310 [Candidatus Aminicenantia bacterium]
MDIIIGFTILLELFVTILGIVVLLKGISSIIGSFAAKYFFDWMGFIDLIAGILILLSISVPWFGVFPILKGLYCVIIGFAK